MLGCLSPNGLTHYRGQTPANKLLVGTLRGVTVLERNGLGSPWSRTETVLEDKHISSLVWDAEASTLFAGTHGGELYMSRDEGHTWEPRMNGITARQVYSVGVRRRGGEVVLFAGVEPASVYRSTDYGESWQELPALKNMPDNEKWSFPPPPHLAHVKNFVIVPNEPTMYACVEQGGLFVSQDDGESWRELDSYSRPDDDVYKDVHRLMVRPSNPQELYMTGGAGTYHSTDGGETWEHRTGRQWDIGYPDQLLISPLDEQVQFLAGSHENPGTWHNSHFANSRIARSRDGGKTWQMLENGLPEKQRGNVEAMSLVGWPGAFEIFAATTDGNVFSSADEGETWQQAFDGIAPISKAGHYRELAGTAA